MANVEKEVKEPLLQRARLLFLRSILLEYTSADNPISRDRIEEKLSSYGVFESSGNGHPVHKRQKRRLLCEQP